MSHQVNINDLSNHVVEEVLVSSFNTMHENKRIGITTKINVDSTGKATAKVSYWLNAASGRVVCESQDLEPLVKMYNAL